MKGEDFVGFGVKRSYLGERILKQLKDKSMRLGKIIHCLFGG